MNGRQDSDGDTAKSRREREKRRNQEANFTQLEGRQTALVEGDVLLVAQMFQSFLHCDDGYLKVKRDLDGDDVHFTWIWTMGAWARHYVYVRCEYWRAGWGLELLGEKMNEVLSGSRRPTRDQYGR